MRPDPPAETRFAPGESGNPSGRPKGSHSVRTALKRRLRKGWEDDPENEDGERVGTWAKQLAEDIADAIENGDADKVRLIATVIDQAEGKPTVHTHVTGVQPVAINFNTNRESERAP